MPAQVTWAPRRPGPDVRQREANLGTDGLVELVRAFLWPPPNVRRVDVDTRIINALRTAETTSSVAPPVWTSSVFRLADVDRAATLATTDHPQEFYGRYGTPATAQVEAAVAAAEGAQAALCTSSGMAAVAAVIFGLLRHGDHVVAPRRMYSATSLLLSETAERFGIKVTFVDPGAEAGAVKGSTRLVWVETPANPDLTVTSISAAARAAHSVNGICAVDSTLATPVHQQPLLRGADLVVHSATKFLGGHNDGLLGVVAGSPTLVERC